MRPHIFDFGKRLYKKRRTGAGRMILSVRKNTLRTCITMYVRPLLDISYSAEFYTVSCVLAMAVVPDTVFILVGRAIYRPAGHTPLAVGLPQLGGYTI